MTNPARSVLEKQLDHAVSVCKDGLHILRHRGPSQVQFWFISLAIGIGAGFAALFFRKGIEGLQAFLYGTDDVQYLHSFASSLPWYLILIIPICGGLIVG
ncbi:MAG: chloride channel protein, partial [Pseudomonadota bacterium]